VEESKAGVAQSIGSTRGRWGRAIAVLAWMKERAHGGGGQGLVWWAGYWPSTLGWPNVNNLIFDLFKPF
jgi:hypothetical protein